MAESDDKPNTNGETDEEIDDGPPLETLRNDFTLCIRKLRTKAQKAEDLTAKELLVELYGNVLPMMLDLVSYVERLEDHAAWASEEISNLSDMVDGSDEQSSQLAPVDADRYLAFLHEAVADLDAQLADRDPESEHAKALGQKKERALALISTTNDVRLEPASDDEEPSGPKEPEAEA